MKAVPEELTLADGTRLSLRRAVSKTDPNKRITGDWLVITPPSGDARTEVFIASGDGKESVEKIYEANSLRGHSAEARTAAEQNFYFWPVHDETEKNRFLQYRRQFKPYGESFVGMDPVAVKLNQTAIHAPEHGIWGTVTCEQCGEKFGVGCHRIYPTNNEGGYIAKLERILLAEHAAGGTHQNIYDLLAYPPC